MSGDARTFRIFIASPGGLEEERLVVHDEIAAFTESSMHEHGAAFSTEGFERVPGTVNRPQEEINSLVRRSDYMIVLIGSRWGSPPGGAGAYTSGTEEEYEFARSCIPCDDSPMKDILLLFRGISDEQLSDPGEQLKRVLAFKQRIEESREIFYKTFDDARGLREEVRNRLKNWALPAGASPGSEALRVPVSGANVAANVPHVKSGADGEPNLIGDTPLQRAEALEAMGLMSQAEAAYAKSIADLDVESLEKYARFLRRTGRLRKSLDINRTILDQLASAPKPDETHEQRSHILTNIGIVERKLGDLRSSRYTLQEAVQTARAGGNESQRALGYALDNLGLTLTRCGDSSAADVCFAEVLQVREASGDLAGLARSLANVARLRKRSGRLAEAKECCERAIAVSRQIDDRKALASACAALGEVLELEMDLLGARNAYMEGLSINESLGMPDNIAMSLSQVARVLIGLDDLVEAERHARRALTESERTSNQEGLTAARHLLGRVYARTGRSDLAIGLLQDAILAYQSTDNPTGEGWARLHLAEVQKRLGLHAEATETLGRVSHLAHLSQNAQLISLADQT